MYLLTEGERWKGNHWLESQIFSHPTRPHSVNKYASAGPNARLVKGYYGTRALRRKNTLLMPVSMETVRMATPDHLPQYNNHIVLTKQESPQGEYRWELYF